MKFQQRLKALQFQRYDFMARTSRGGIACDIPCTPSSDVREGRMQGLRGLAAVPAGSGKAWPDNEPTRRAAEQRPGPTGVEGAGGSGGHGRASRRGAGGSGGHGLGAGGWRQGLAAVPVGGGGARPRCRWVAAGPGRASRSTTPSRRLACGDLAGGPPPTGTHSGRAPQSITTERPEHQRRHEQHNNQAPHQRARTYKKTTSAIGCQPVVELGGFEPPTFSLRTRRATNCAIAPRTQTA